jgi:dipeptidase E
MKLYLSSFRWGNRFDELRQFVGVGARVAVISNAVDFIADEARSEYARTVFDPLAYLEEQGFKANDLDLRRYFGRRDDLRTVLIGVQLVWAVGGNAFLLRRAMRESGFDTIIGDLVAGGRLVYAGWSAGAVVAGPTLRGIDLMDEPELTVPHYPPARIWEGLGLVDFSIVPHIDSDHPETHRARAAADWLERQGIPFRGLRDGDVIVI